MGILLAVGLICAVWAGVASVRIAQYVKDRGVSVSFVWLRVMILKYLHDYSKLTQEETGRIGPLFYHYIVPLNLALLIVIVLAISHWA